MTMHDMGGERAARGEWVTHFPHPTAILFLASLAEYDQHVEEAEREGEVCVCVCERERERERDCLMRE